MKIADVEVLDYLTGRNSLLDSVLEELRVSSSKGGLMVELTFSARAGADYGQLKLVFECVTQFMFNFSDDYIFGNVEDVKFVRTENEGFYLSIDPEPGNEMPANGDHDLVASKSIRAEISSR